jgi:hypothetical protein
MSDINGPLPPESLVGALHDRDPAEVLAQHAAAQRRREGVIRRTWYRIEHRLHWYRHPDLHASHCTCKGTGKCDRPASLDAPSDPMDIPPRSS